MTSRTVVVTGGNRGIGAAVAARLVADGHQVASISRTGGAAASVLDVRADLTAAGQPDEALAGIRAGLGPIDALVCNAGVTDAALLPASDEARARQVLETNLWLPWKLCRSVSHDMLARRWGRIVFIASVIGASGAPGQTMYAATKAAQTGLARSIGWELGRRGVTANVVSPGMIETDMLAGVTARRRADLLGRTPAARAGKPEEVADVCAFLLSDSAAYVNGANIPVSGGLGAGL